MKTNDSTWTGVLHFLATLTVLNAIISGFFVFRDDAQRVSYAELKAAVRDGRVASVSLGPEQIRAQLRRSEDAAVPPELVATRAADPQLFAELQAHGVRVTVLRGPSAFWSWGVCLIPLLAWAAFLLGEHLRGRARRTGPAQPIRA